MALAFPCVWNALPLPPWARCHCFQDPLTGLPLPDPPGLGCPPPSLGGHNLTSSRKKKFSILLPQRLGQCPMHPCFLIESQQIWSNLRMSRHRPAGQRGWRNDWERFKTCQESFSLGCRKQCVGREEIQMMPIVQDNRPLMPKTLRKNYFITHLPLFSAFFSDVFWCCGFLFCFFSCCSSCL